MRKLLPLFIATWLVLFICAPVYSQTVLVDELSIDVPHAAPLIVANRTIVTFRSRLLGETPELRAARARVVINEVLDDEADVQVSLQPMQDDFIVLLGGRRAFIVAVSDIDPLEHESSKATAEAAAENLRQVVRETHESRNLRFMLTALAYSAAATVVFVLLIRLINFIRQRVKAVLPSLMQRKTQALKLGATPVVEANQLYPVVSRVLHVLRWTVMLLLGFEWLSFVLSCFPYTRPWGEKLNTYLLEVAVYLFDGIVSALPGLGIAVAIFFIARAVISFFQRLLTRMAAPGNSDAWLNTETLQPTRRLTAMAIWLFALAMAYPYLPGSGTEAFKGLSVLVGLMISLGASSVVGQAASGLILTYTRTLRIGEYVRVGEHEGSVTEVGIFTTRIRTGIGEVLTIPNSMITGTVTKNYSRGTQGHGYLLDTTVTIGYDTPWRQVEAMLIEAARRTEGLLASPTPLVLQTELSDYYPQYRLVVQALSVRAQPRALLLSNLHANIQDVFNEYGVQIMSPHYVADPSQAKLVPEDQLYAAPARREGDT